MPVADLGEGPGGPPPLSFLDQNEARRAEKKIFVAAPPPPPLSQGVEEYIFRCAQGPYCRLPLSLETIMTNQLRTEGIILWNRDITDAKGLTKFGSL